MNKIIKEQSKVPFFVKEDVKIEIRDNPPKPYYESFLVMKDDLEEWFFIEKTDSRMYGSIKKITIIRKNKPNLDFIVGNKDFNNIEKVLEVIPFDYFIDEVIALRKIQKSTKDFNKNSNHMPDYTFLNPSIYSKFFLKKLELEKK